MEDLKKKMVRISKKYSFAVLGIALGFLAPIVIKELNFDPLTSQVAIVSLHVLILVISITYITGQAKIDLSGVNIGTQFNKLP